MQAWSALCPLTQGENDGNCEKTGRQEGRPREEGCAPCEEGRCTRQEGCGPCEEGRCTRQEGCGPCEEGSRSRQEGCGSCEEGCGSCDEGCGPCAEGGRAGQDAWGPCEKGGGPCEEASRSRQDGCGPCQESSSRQKARRREGTCCPCCTDHAQPPGCVALPDGSKTLIPSPAPGRTTAHRAMHRHSPWGPRYRPVGWVAPPCGHHPPRLRSPARPA